jgi:hypothetical protein
LCRRALTARSTWKNSSPPHGAGCANQTRPSTTYASVPRPRTLRRSPENGSLRSASPARSPKASPERPEPASTPARYSQDAETSAGNGDDCGVGRLRLGCLAGGQDVARVVDGQGAEISHGRDEGEPYRAREGRVNDFLRRILGRGIRPETQTKDETRRMGSG